MHYIIEQRCITLNATTRALLVLFNIIFWVCGLSLIWSGVWMQTNIQSALTVSEAYSERAPFSVFLMGVFIVFIVSLACMCIVKVQSPMLLIYGGSLLTMFFVLISLSMYLHSYKDNLLLSLSNDSYKYIGNYGDNYTLQAEYMSNSTQNYGCGKEIYRNWPKIYMSWLCIKKLKLRARTPHVKSNCDADCLDELQNAIGEIFTRLSVIISTTALFMLLGSILFFGLAKVHRRIKYELMI